MHIFIKHLYICMQGPCKCQAIVNPSNVTSLAVSDIPFINLITQNIFFLCQIYHRWWINYVLLKLDTKISIWINIMFIFSATSNRTICHESMLYMYDYIYNSCNDKVKCYLRLPPYQAIDGTTAVCKRRYPNVESFRFRGVYLDIGCGFGKNCAHK